MRSLKGEGVAGEQACQMPMAQRWGHGNVSCFVKGGHVLMEEDALRKCP